jgi:O-antigen ligase
MMGSGALFLTTRWKTRFFVFCLMAIPIFYVSTRASGYWSGQNIVNFVSENISLERAQSLQYRLENEDVLAEKARQRPLFGWGGWGRARVYDDEGRDITTTDGLWIIIFGNNGLVGLLGLTGAVLMPILVLMRHYPPERWGHPMVAPAASLAVMLLLYMIDNLLNAMTNPMFMLVAGGIAGLTFESLDHVGVSHEARQAPPSDDVPRTRFL